jgi:hypothetical protein
MLKRLLAVVLLFASCNAMALPLTGNTVTFELLYPTNSTPYGPYNGEYVVGSNVEIPDAYGFFDVDFTATQLIIKFKLSSSWQPGAFNGFAVRDALGAMGAFAVTLDPTSNMSGIDEPYRLVTTDDSFSLNWSGLNFHDFTQVVLNVTTAEQAQVPEPGSLALLLVGLAITARTRMRSSGQLRLSNDC